MEHYVGIDLSLKESSVCVVDTTGKVVRKVKVASEPEALAEYFEMPPCSDPRTRGIGRKQLVEQFVRCPRIIDQNKIICSPC